MEGNEQPVKEASLSKDRCDFIVKSIYKLFDLARSRNNIRGGNIRDEIDKYLKELQTEREILMTFLSLLATNWLDQSTAIQIFRGYRRNNLKIPKLHSEDPEWATSAIYDIYYTRQVLVILGYKNDKGCTLVILPDVIIKMIIDLTLCRKERK